MVWWRIVNFTVELKAVELGTRPRKQNFGTSQSILHGFPGETLGHYATVSENPSSIEESAASLVPDGGWAGEKAIALLPGTWFLAMKDLHILLHKKEHSHACAVASGVG